MKDTLLFKETERTYHLAQYSREKLNRYADSFKALAKSFSAREDSAGGETDFAGEDRTLYFYEKELKENKGILAEQLEEMAEILAEIAGEVFTYRPFSSSKKRRIFKLMRTEGVRVTDIYYIEEDENVRIAVTMAMERKGKMPVKEAVNMLSVILNERLVPDSHCPDEMDTLLRTYLLVPEAKYSYFTGVAKAIKESEERSGDNYSVLESERGYVHFLLSDGVGSGESASLESEKVLELAEKFLEAGYEAKAAGYLVNKAKVLAGEEDGLSTLDICSVNLYTGDCEFVKWGACASFIKRGRSVEKLCEDTFPLGSFAQREMSGLRRKLSDGDYIILISDGVTDVFCEKEYEEGFLKMLQEIEEGNPKEMAEKLMQGLLFMANGQIRDDMTVLVAGIWEKS